MKKRITIKDLQSSACAVLNPHLFEKPAKKKKRPELRGRLESVRIAVNEEFVQFADKVRAKDVVALIPPVAGG